MTTVAQALHNFDYSLPTSIFLTEPFLNLWGNKVNLINMNSYSNSKDAKAVDIMIVLSIILTNPQYYTSMKEIHLIMNSNILNEIKTNANSLIAGKNLPIITYTNIRDWFVQFIRYKTKYVTYEDCINYGLPLGTQLNNKLDRSMLQKYYPIPYPQQYDRILKMLVTSNNYDEINKDPQFNSLFS